LEFTEQTRGILEHSTEFELYSLNGEPEEGTSAIPQDRFALWPTYGKVAITDQNQKTALINALYASVDAYYGHAAMCFMPHHGIHASDGKHQVDLVICFSCRQIEGKVDGVEISVLNDGTPMALYNQVLQAGGIPLDPEMKREEDSRRKDR